jgi:predicted TIM-barrel fold metal-dependent hydrolase
MAPIAGPAVRAVDIDDVARRKVFEGNARRLFRLTV